MDRIINTLGLAIIASKYAAVILLAGFSITTGTIAAETMLLSGMESNE